MPTFSGIYVALHGMLAQQKALEVTEHNVANANTPGYHRQEAVMKAGQPDSSVGAFQFGAPGDMGTGVLVDRIRRFSLDYYDARYRNELSTVSMYSKESSLLKEVEINLSDTTADGLSSRLDSFFAGWQGLSADPEITTLRDDLREKANDLVRSFHDRALKLIDIRRDQNLAIVQSVDEINKTADQVARLNTDIARSLSAGNQPNDLLDERDRQLDRLAEMAGATSHLQDDGQALVSIGGHTLVMGTKTFKLVTATDPTNENLEKVSWEDGQSFRVQTGELAGYFDGRDRVIVDQLNRLNATASHLITEVNALHTAGYGLDDSHGAGNFFFSGTDALSIAVNPAFSDPLKIAAAKNASSPGDGTNALEISRIQDKVIAALNNTSIRQYNGERITTLALEVNRATNSTKNHQLVVDALGAQREEVNGVNLDEEAANMLKYQRAYQASVRLMTAVDEMISRMIDTMGLVGR